jgi:hypothetical protein
MKWLEKVTAFGITRNMFFFSLINQPDVNVGINIKEFNKLYGSEARHKY